MNCQLSTELLPPLPTSTPAPKTGAGVLSDCQKSLAEFAALAAKKIQSFSAGAHPRVASLAPSGQFTFCTWQKIHLRLQVWNLFAYSEQIMRAADCKNWRKSPKGFFDKLQAPLLRKPEQGCFMLP